jgi:hypothetical protein
MKQLLQFEIISILNKSAIFSHHLLRESGDLVGIRRFLCRAFPTRLSENYYACKTSENSFSAFVFTNFSQKIPAFTGAYRRLSKSKSGCQSAILVVASAPKMKFYSSLLQPLHRFWIGGDGLLRVTPASLLI